MAAETACRGDLQLARWMLARLRKLGARPLQALRHLACRAPEQFALLGENEPARMAVKQRCTQLTLKRANLPTNGGLTQTKYVASLGKAAGFCDGIKNPDAVPIHRVSPVMRFVHVGG